MCVCVLVSVRLCVGVGVSVGVVEGVGGVPIGRQNGMQCIVS